MSSSTHDDSQIPADEASSAEISVSRPQNVKRETGTGDGHEQGPEVGQTMSVRKYDKSTVHVSSGKNHDTEQNTASTELAEKAVEESEQDSDSVDREKQSLSSTSLARSDSLHAKELPETPQTPPPLPEKEQTYLDPTPRTPMKSRSPSRMSSDYGDYNEKDPQYAPEFPSALKEEGHQAAETDPQAEKDSNSEIQSIMEQFTGETGGPGEEEIMSPRKELAGPIMSAGAGQFPPRLSSLEPINTAASGVNVSSPVKSGKDSPLPPPVPPKPTQSPIKSPALQAIPPVSPTSLSGPPPPEPEPDQPFDFHRFLEQLRHKSADPVAKFLRSFLTEFGKKQWMVHEQVKIIGDFLAFITNKMALCDVWRGVSDAEFDNAKEGMEKLVMNRLYSQTFSPAIAPTPPLPKGKGKRRDVDKLLVPGRRGQHQEDVERDDILAQKIRIYGWVGEEHLDIPPVGPNGQRFLKLAQQELLKIKGYRAPRDKVICVLNCCKVIFGLLKNAKSADTSADSFIPLLIYVVLHANPEHLVSNIQYILRFRNQDKLGGEAGYYLSSLSGAIQFIENLDRTSLTVSDEVFERNVEIAVSAIAEQNREAETASSPGAYVSEKSKLAQPEVTPRNSMDATYSSPGRSGDFRSTGSMTADGSFEDNAAVAGLLRTIQKPLSTIGRIFSDEPSTQPSRSGPALTPQPGQTPRLSPSLFQIPRSGGEEKSLNERNKDGGASGTSKQSVQKLDAQEAAARQASAEAAEARRIQRQEHKNVVETLYGMFPNLDKEVIDDVVRLKEGRVGLAVDACLALSAGS